MLPRHKTKIVCTIGPASRSAAVLRKMVEGGMNVARLNFSHGTFEEHRRDIQRIRSAAKQADRPVLILVDLPGPKIRIGKLHHEPLELKKGATVTLTTEDIVGTVSRIPVSYKRLPESVSRGNIIYLNDGFLQLRVKKKSATEVKCGVLVGGPLLSYKGLNLPKAKLFIDAVTEKDLEVTDFGLKERITTFCISFVEKAEDILRIKEFARKRGKSIKVVAKIERVEAVNNIDEILEVADAIMVARGDLGVQIPIEEVPGVQKKLIRKANLLGRPVITATQMLESMTENIRPTRAEATDVANAILDGTDAVMLSEETAIGRYPVEALKTMVRIARSIESQRGDFSTSRELETLVRSSPSRRNRVIGDVVSLNVIEATRALNTRLILTPTNTGNAPRRISRFKPDCWILAFSNDESTCKFLVLSSGVYPFLIKRKPARWDDLIKKFIRSKKLARKGDKVVLAEAAAPGLHGDIDSLRIITLE